MPKFNMLKKLPAMFGKSVPKEEQVTICEKDIYQGRLIADLVNSDAYLKALAPIYKEIQEEAIKQLRSGKNSERMSGMLDCIDLIIRKMNLITIKADKSAKLLTNLKDK